MVEQFQNQTNGSTLSQCAFQEMLEGIGKNDHFQPMLTVTMDLKES